MTGYFLQVMEQSDILYGRPGDGQIKRMQSAIAHIMSVSSWEEWLQALNVVIEGDDLDPFLTRFLRGSWHRSLQKGYHRKASFSSLTMSFWSL